VLDTWQHVAPLKRRDRYGKEYELAARLRKLAHDHPITLLVVHHTNRPRLRPVGDDWTDRVRDASGLLGAADAMCPLDRERPSPMVVLRTTHSATPG